MSTIGRRRRTSDTVSRVVLISACAAGLLVASTAYAAEIDPFQKEAIGLIKETTIQLLLFAVGVFSIAGSIYAGDQSRRFRSRSLLALSFLALGISLVCGLFTIGNLIYQLIAARVDLVAGGEATLYAIQLVAFLVGGLCFMMFVLRNVRGGQ